jgi:hypothetical protein
MDDTSYIGRAAVPPPPGVREPLPEPPPRPPRSRALVWVLVMASVAVILLATGVLFGWALHTTPGQSPAAVAAPRAPSKSPSPSPKRSTPRAVAQKYLDALAASDAAAGDAQVCSLLRGKTPNDLNLPFALGDLVTFEAAEGTVTGPTATVPAKVTVPVLGSTNFSVYLVDEHGVWKVCGIGPA